VLGISMTKVWVCPGGIAAAGRPGGLRFRNAFLGTVAAGALSLAFGGPALAGPDACTPSGGGTIETCSGNQSAGIASGTDFTAPPVTTLNVNNLNQAIAPASGTNGITFTSAGAVTVQRAPLPSTAIPEPSASPPRATIRTGFLPEATALAR
jgi:hypothetical protein